MTGAQKSRGQVFILYIGRRTPPGWLFRDFILGYFGKKISTAQKGYQGFVNDLLEGKHFDIGEFGISQSSRRVSKKIHKDKKLKTKVQNIEKKLNE